MKKILLAASAVALLAAAGCADKKGTSTAVSGADTVTVAASASVAYFNQMCLRDRAFTAPRINNGSSSCSDNI